MIALSPRRTILYLSRGGFTLVLTFLLSLFFFNNGRISKKEWVVSAAFILLWLAMEYWGKLNNSALKNELSRQISNHIKAYAVFIVLVFLFYFIIPDTMPKRSGLIGILIGIPILSIAINFLLFKLLSRTNYSTENIKYALVAGVGKVAKNVEMEIYAQHVPGYQIKGFINCRRNEVCTVGEEKVVSDLKNINEYLKSNPVDEIVIASPGKLSSSEIQTILTAADYHGIRVKYILDYHEIFGKNYKITRFGQIDAVNIRQLPVDGKFASFIKNSFDRVFSFFALLLLSPVFILLAILIKLESPGPVLYCPVRIGKSGKPFKLYKFRSMRGSDNTSGGTLSTSKNDPRITPLGKILRKYSLDELPQFINVFLGEMGVVGPRPHRRYLNQQLQESEIKYMVRHYVKPGITGWAQVNGWRGPTDTEEQKRQRTIHDLWYCENWSFWLDIKIIYLTLFSKKVHHSAF
ncbi:MAG TPA: exopolysaccharide biosynthesis polyprenyl glycosylphosphotransferase [Flavitalea sp.]|nr:exopolysaccharide biosynthesis polyprenyl glycosylphosphotransferase [Flavitalea sp.]